MEETRQEFDVVVVGAGPAGSATAYHFARAGSRVALLERGWLHDAGPRWINAIPPRLFTEAGIPQPTGAEVVHAGPTILMRGKIGRRRLSLPQGPAWDLDMRKLVARVQALALDAGARPFDHAKIKDLTLDHGRPTTLAIEQHQPGEHPRRLLLGARLFVDATGLAADLRNRVPELDRDCPTVTAEHICSAAQETRVIKDRAGAAAHLEREGVRPGVMDNRTGVAGGYSIITINVSEDFSRAVLLTGVITDGQGPDGPALMAELRGRHPWIGELVFGGAGRIPLRRPYARLGAAGIALVGNAGCMVFPAHGSGVGSGMIAGRLLAETVRRFADIGSAEALWAYSAAIQRGFGAVHAYYDVFRRMSQKLGEDGVERLLSSGTMTPGMAQAGLEQVVASPSLQDLLDLQRGLRREPRLLATLAPVLLKAQAALTLARRYPEKPNRRALKLWARGMALIFSERPEIE